MQLLSRAIRGLRKAEVTQVTRGDLAGKRQLSVEIPLPQADYVLLDGRTVPAKTAVETEFFRIVSLAAKGEYDYASFGVRTESGDSADRPQPRSTEVISLGVHPVAEKNALKVSLIATNGQFLTEYPFTPLLQVISTLQANALPAQPTTRALRIV